MLKLEDSCRKLKVEKMRKVVVAIVQNEGKILMLRSKEREGDLRWRFPGGRVEEGESEGGAACREVAEETGIICRPVRKLGERIHPSTKRIISYHVCDFIDGDTALKEPYKFDQIAWMTPLEVFRNVTSSIFRPVKDYLRSIS
jgi:8-oxo-dGTP diphosphatase